MYPNRQEGSVVPEWAPPRAGVRIPVCQGTAHQPPRPGGAGSFIARPGRAPCGGWGAPHRRLSPLGRRYRLASRTLRSAGWRPGPVVRGGRRPSGTRASRSFRPVSPDTRRAARRTPRGPRTPWSRGWSRSSGGPPAGAPGRVRERRAGPVLRSGGGAVASPRPRAGRVVPPPAPGLATGFRESRWSGPGGRESVRKRYGPIQSDQAVYALLRTTLVGAVRLLRRSAYPPAYTRHRRQPAGTCKLFGMPRNRNTGAPRLVITT